MYKTRFAYQRLPEHINTDKIPHNR